VKERKVDFLPEAKADLLALYDWVADCASEKVAIGYLARVESFCLRLDIGSHRGTLRSDIRPGLRIVGFERRLAIAFVVTDDAVTILRIFGAGRDWESAL